MSNVIGSLIGMGIFLFFLSAIAWKVRELPLLLIMGLVAAMAIADFVRAIRSGES